MVKLKPSMYQLHVLLDRIDPTIWRKLRVPADITFGDLHYVLQDAFGWENSHLHQFRIDKRRIGMTGIEEFDISVENEDALTLVSVLPKGARFVYEYDFGDGWEHIIFVEDVFRTRAKLKHPECLDGARACPPEDCGGPPGYADLLQELQRSTKRAVELREWLGGSFDEYEFDLASTNRDIRRQKTRRRTEEAARE